MPQADPKGTKVKTLETPIKTLIVRLDPDFEASKVKEPFYEFTRRTFRGDNRKMGPYSDVPNDRD